MNKYITQRIENAIEENSYNWAKNYVAKKWQSQFDTADAMKQIESADHNMAELERQNEFLTKLLKDETKAAKNKPKKA